MELTSDDRKRTKAILAAVVLHGNGIEADAVAGASTEPLHFRAWGWVPIPLVALRIGLHSRGLLPLLEQRPAAYELLSQGGVTWVRPLGDAWATRAARRATRHRAVYSSFLAGVGAEVRMVGEPGIGPGGRARSPLVDDARSSDPGAMSDGPRRSRLSPPRAAPGGAGAV